MPEHIPIGLDKAAYAINTQDDAAGVAYQAPVLMPGLRKAKFSPKGSLEFINSDNVASDSLFQGGPVEIEIERKYLTQAEEAAFGGHTVTGGVLIKNKDDAPPDVAFLCRVKKDNGTYKYYCFYKGKFLPPDQSFESEEPSGGKPKPQFSTLKGTFLARIYDGAYQTSTDAEAADFNPATAAAWFTAVGAADTTPPTISSSVPTTNATGIAVGAAYAITFSEAIMPSTVTAANFFMIKDSDNSIVAGALTQNVGKDVITFTPTSNLTAGAVYFMCTTQGIKDLAGNALAANSARKFTVAP